MSGNDLQRRILQCRIDRTCRLGLAAVCGVVIDVFLIVVADLGRQPALAIVPVVALVALLVLLVAQTRHIGTLQRTRELNRRADELELAAQAVRARLSSCAHPHAEPVDLSTGERVAWVCPDCPADLPAGWSPARVTGTVDISAAAVLSGAGTFSAKARQAACDCDSRIEVHTFEDGSPVASYCSKCGRGTWHRPVGASAFAADAEIGHLTEPGDEITAHFAALARVGRDRCASPCPYCDARGGAAQALDSLMSDLERDRRGTARASADDGARAAGFKDAGDLKYWFLKGRFGE